jgi:hypothetical protein
MFIMLMLVFGGGLVRASYKPYSVTNVPVPLDSHGVAKLGKDLVRVETTGYKTAPLEIEYELLISPSHGSVLAFGKKLGRGGLFTQEAVNAGAVQYVATSAMIWDDEFEVAVTDFKVFDIDMLVSVAAQHHVNCASCVYNNEDQ